MAAAAESRVDDSLHLTFTENMRHSSFGARRAGKSKARTKNGKTDHRPFLAKGFSSTDEKVAIFL